MQFKINPEYGQAGQMNHNLLMQIIFKNQVSLLKSLIPKEGSFSGNILTLMTGTALGQGLTMLAAPLLSRLYAPEDFGTLAVYVSIASLPTAIASWRYEWAIPLPDNNENAANLVSLCLIILLGMTLLAGLGLLVGGDLLLHLIKAPKLKPYLWLIPFSLLGAGTYQIMNNWAIRQKAFGGLARTKLSQSLGRIVTQIILGLLKLCPIGLILGDLVGRASGGSTLATMAWRQDSVAFKKISLPGMRWVASRYRRFPLFAGASTLLNTATPQVPIFMLSAFYGAQVVGWYSLGQMVIAVPMSLVAMSGAQVFRAEAARLVKKEPKALEHTFYRASKKLLLGTLPIGMIALASPWFFPLIFGEKWREAGTYTQALTLMFITQFVSSPLSHLETHELQHWEFFWDLGRLVLTVTIFFVSHWLGCLPTTSVFLYSLVMGCSMVALFFLNALAIKRDIKRAIV